MPTVAMSPAIGYLRVSTREQGRSGLGLAAQRSDIQTFGEREGLSVKSWYQDIQTGAGADALLLRPGLAAALKDARAARCPLIVSRLDRLSRNVHFITGLMEHKVHFIVAALPTLGLSSQQLGIRAEELCDVAIVLVQAGETPVRELRSYQTAYLLSGESPRAEI